MSGLTRIAHGWSRSWGEATVRLFVGFSKVNYRLGLGHILFTRTWLSIFHPGWLNRSHLLSRTNTHAVQGHMLTYTPVSEFVRKFVQDLNSLSVVLQLRLNQWRQLAHLLNLHRSTHTYIKYIKIYLFVTYSYPRLQSHWATTTTFINK